MIIKCKHCKGELVMTAPNMKVCDECTRKRKTRTNREYVKKKPKPFACLNCGVMGASQSGTKFCSNTCRCTHWNRTNRDVANRLKKARRIYSSIHINLTKNYIIMSEGITT